MSEWVCCEKYIEKPVVQTWNQGQHINHHSILCNNLSGHNEVSRENAWLSITNKQISLFQRIPTIYCNFKTLL